MNTQVDKIIKKANKLAKKKGEVFLVIKGEKPKIIPLKAYIAYYDAMYDEADIIYEAAY